MTIVNFTLSPSGLEDQLLALVVAEERPDLEEAKNQLIMSSAKMKQELKEIEDKILHRLTSSEGSPVDDEALISTLEQSKVKSQDIKVYYYLASIYCFCKNSRYFLLYFPALFFSYICDD